MQHQQQSTSSKLPSVKPLAYCQHMHAHAEPQHCRGTGCRWYKSQPMHKADHTRYKSSICPHTRAAPAHIQEMHWRHGLHSGQHTCQCANQPGASSGRYLCKHQMLAGDPGTCPVPNGDEINHQVPQGTCNGLLQSHWVLQVTRRLGIRTAAAAGAELGNSRQPGRGHAVIHCWCQSHLHVWCWCLHVPG